jgi:hypothetical protein
VDKLYEFICLNKNLLVYYDILKEKMYNINS